jgi:formamidopyrimidine-DNA glycosylase
MPELPEVETIRRSLQREICGETIASAKVHNPSLRTQLDSKAFVANLTGKKITALSRRGKVLLLHLSEKWTWIVHFGMTGKLIVASRKEPVEPHTHIQVQLQTERELRFVDMRRFGQMAVIREREARRFPLIVNLGLDPLSKSFSARELSSLCCERKKKIRDLIMDQRRIAGLGNIYAHEILHEARIRPDRPSGGLSQEEIRRLVRSTKTILAEAIRYRGTSVRDYLDGNGKPGSYQNRLKVYQRRGLPCLRCGSTILHISGGRSSFYCPGCQT